MPLSVSNMNAQPEKKKHVRYVGKDGEKPTLNDIITQSKVEVATFKNENEEPVGIRLDSIDQKFQRTGERGASEWLWIQPEEQAKVPVSDVTKAHRLKLVKND